MQKWNAKTIHNDLEWLREIVACRLKLFLGEKAIITDINEIPMPAAIEDKSEYHSFVRSFSFEERLIFILALTPYVSPQLLDAFLIRDERTGNMFTEFGGVPSNRHRGFIPTVETALFLLAGDDLSKRFAITQLFSADHFFTENDILKMARVETPDPVFSGEFELNTDVLEFITNGIKREPAYSNDFPATKLKTEQKWKDKIFDKKTDKQLEEIKNWVLYNQSLRQEWELSPVVQPGYRCLLHGPPGTGKTFFCALLGKETGRTVYRIDLSGLVSKYVGETIKNLDKLFRQATESILFFDEADALFGKRTKVSDAHDRFANQEVSYLLQRIENFAGVVILASNYKENIDDAFMRRFQTVVEFPVPKEKERELLWKNSFPKIKPRFPGLYKELGQKFELTGGNITNAAYYSSMLAYTKLKQSENLLHTLERSKNKGKEKKIRELKAALKSPSIESQDVFEAVKKEYIKEGKSFPRKVEHFTTLIK